MEKSFFSLCPFSLALFLTNLAALVKFHFSMVIFILIFLGHVAGHWKMNGGPWTPDVKDGGKSTPWPGARQQIAKQVLVVSYLSLLFLKISSVIMKVTGIQIWGEKKYLKKQNNITKQSSGALECSTHGYYTFVDLRLICILLHYIELHVVLFDCCFSFSCPFIPYLAEGIGNDDPVGWDSGRESALTDLDKIWGEPPHRRRRYGDFRIDELGFEENPLLSRGLPSTFHIILSYHTVLNVAHSASIVVTFCWPMFYQTAH